MHAHMTYSRKVQRLSFIASWVALLVAAQGNAASQSLALPGSSAATGAAVVAKSSAPRLTLDVAAIEHERILKAATAALALEPITITQFRAALSDGGPNDFYSNGDYWWPDPTKTNGLPYIQRDGESNPNNFNQHRRCIARLRDAVAALGAAYKMTGDDRYALKGAELLRVFFLDPRFSRPLCCITWVIRWPCSIWTL